MRCARALAAAVAATPRLRRRVAVTFDIDGVLLRGNTQLPRARESLMRCVAHRIPFLLLTNGGGEPEAVKAAKLSAALDFAVPPSQVVLSHTPLRPLLARHARDKVLVLGCRDVVSVARSYGAQRVYTIADLAHDEPTRYPFLHYEHRPLGDATVRSEPFAAVFILHTPTTGAPSCRSRSTCCAAAGRWEAAAPSRRCRCTHPIRT